MNSSATMYGLSTSMRRMNSIKPDLRGCSRSIRIIMNRVSATIHIMGANTLDRVQFRRWRLRIGGCRLSESQNQWRAILANRFCTCGRGCQSKLETMGSWRQTASSGRVSQHRLSRLFAYSGLFLACLGVGLRRASENIHSPSLLLHRCLLY